MTVSDAGASAAPDLIETVIDHVLGCRFEDLGAATVARMKTLAADTMGAAVAGSAGEGLPGLAALAADWGGKPEASLLVHGTRVPAHHAALVNCTMARAWDFDEVHEGGGGHLCASVVPTAFVLAQCAPQPVSGREFLLGLVLATDLIARLRMAQTTRSGWVAETFAPFGVVAMAARVLGLDRALVRAAMGLAYAQCASNTQGTVDGALSVRLQQGLAAQAGVLAVRLAQAGFAGPQGILQGRFGLFPLYARGQYDPQSITGALGRRWACDASSIKPYPSCKFTHIPIAVAAALVREHGIAAADIAHIEVRTNRDGYDKCAASPAKRRPRSVPDMQFSLPLTVALGVLRGTVTLGDLCPQVWNDPAVQALGDRVEVVVDAALDALPVMISPAEVTIRLHDGRRFGARADSVPGAPDQPMGRAALADKYHGCVAAALRPLPAGAADVFFDALARLEQLQDVRPLATLLVAAPGTA